jgi:hypothetical protein
MRKLAISLLILMPVENAFSQESIFKGPVVYREVAGAAFSTYNANVEHLIFSKSKWYVNGRAGFGYLSYDGDSDYQIPLGVKVYHGNRNSHPELGLYLTYSSSHHNHNIGYEYVINTLHFVPSASYRFQRQHGGVFFRVSYAPGIKLKEFTDPSPWMGTSKTFFHSFGVALGYYFNKSEDAD